VVLDRPPFGSIGEWDLAEYAFMNAVDLSPEMADSWALLAEPVNSREKAEKMPSHGRWNSRRIRLLCG
jgi:hypothetical protein